MELTFQRCYVYVQSVVGLVRFIYVIDCLVWVFCFLHTPQLLHPVECSSNGCVCLIVLSRSSYLTLPSLSTFALVLPSNFNLFSFTSWDTSVTGLIMVMLLNFIFGIIVTGEPVSTMNFIGGVITNNVLW